MKIKIYPPDYTKIPGTGLMADGVRRYIERGYPPGHFLTAVICNNLTEAFNRADDENTRLMRDWAAFFRWEIQGNAWGSKEIMQEWMNHFEKIGRAHV